jgi:hypothetical protein
MARAPRKNDIAAVAAHFLVSGKITRREMVDVLTGYAQIRGAELYTWSSRRRQTLYPGRVLDLMRDAKAGV